MYGSTMVTISEDQQQLFVTIDEKKVMIDLDSFVCLLIQVCFFQYFVIQDVTCDDEEIQSMIDLTVKHLSACIQPLKLTPATT